MKYLQLFRARDTAEKSKPKLYLKLVLLAVLAISMTPIVSSVASATGDDIEVVVVETEAVEAEPADDFGLEQPEAAESAEIEAVEEAEPAPAEEAEIAPAGEPAAGEQSAVSAAAGPIGIVPAAYGDYNLGDVAVINKIIQDNGLNQSIWPYNNPDAWPVQVGNSNGIQWVGNSPDRRIAVLYMQNMGVPPNGGVPLSGEIDVSGLEKLTMLSLMMNNITGIQADNCPMLWSLNIAFNNFSGNLDLTHMSKLTEINVSSNNLTSVDTSNCPGLVSYHCTFNKLTILDISGNPQLTTLECFANPNISTLIEKNGNTLYITASGGGHAEFVNYDLYTGGTISLLAVSETEPFMYWTSQPNIDDPLFPLGTLAIDFKNPHATATVTAVFGNYAGEIDLSETTSGGAGYSVTGSTQPYSVQFPGSNGTVSNPNRVLTFNSFANGFIYRVYQSGVLAVPGTAEEPKLGTAIFNEIIIESGVHVIIDIDAIDLIGTITLKGSASVSFRLMDGSFVHGNIGVPAAAELLIISFDNDSTDSLTVYNTNAANAAIGGTASFPASGQITLGGGSVTINHGNPNAISNSAGIGSAPGSGNVPTGDINITGGSVTVNMIGNAQGAGIGGHSSSVGTAAGGSITIDFASGTGSVTVTNDYRGAAIGGGAEGTGAFDIQIENGVILATGGYGAGIGGGASGASANIGIAAAADVTAYSRGPNSKPAIDLAGVNSSDGFFVNAAMDEVLSTSAGTDIYVYMDGNRANRVRTLTLPADYRCFAYSTAADSAQDDNLYADLAAGDIRVIDRVSDDDKVIYSVKSRNGYSADGGINGALPVKLRTLPLAGVPSADNIQQFAADLVSTGHAIVTGSYVDGGFYYGTALGLDGRVNAAIDLPWTDAYDPAEMRENTGADSLIANTRYYESTYIVVNGDYWLTPAPGDHSFQSADVTSFVTLPYISEGHANPGSNAGEALVSATFEGGDEALVVTIYWDTAAIDPSDPATWAGLDHAVLPTTDYDSSGFTDFPLPDLTAGGLYYLLVVAENETGHDAYLITYNTTVGFTFVKVDENGQPLEGVSFALFVCTLADDPSHVDHDDLVDAGSCWGDPFLAVSAADGSVAFAGLAPGSYMLVEMQTRPGYQLPRGQWLIVVDDLMEMDITAHGLDSVSQPPAFYSLDDELYLPNYRQFDMPMAGGYGRVAMTVLGIMLLGGAVVYVLMPRRKRAARGLPVR